MEFGKGAASYYEVLGVSSDSSDEQIRRAYRKLAMQWHPDKWTMNPSHLGQAKQKFQEIQEAYSVLSDGSKRTLYDVGLYNPYEEEEEDEVEGFTDFVKEMVSLMDDARKQETKCSIEELKNMFWDMAQDMAHDMAQGFGFQSDCSSSTKSGSYLEKEVPPYGSQQQQMFSGSYDNNIWENTNPWGTSMFWGKL